MKRKEKAEYIKERGMESFCVCEQENDFKKVGYLNNNFKTKSKPSICVDRIEGIKFHFS